MGIAKKFLDMIEASVESVEDMIQRLKAQGKSVDEIVNFIQLRQVKMGMKAASTRHWVEFVKGV